jgi:ribonucleoside-diphosphate reductase alpha chain
MCKLKKNAPPVRRKLIDTRTAVTHKFDIAGHEGHLTVGLFDDGKPGELFITMAKEGSTLEVLVKKFAHKRFEPSGFTKNPEIQSTSSILDYIFRWMGGQFIPGFKEKNKPIVEPSELSTAPCAVRI